MIAPNVYTPGGNDIEWFLGLTGVREILPVTRPGFIERKESLLLVGPVGVGKTHLSQAIGHVACTGQERAFDKTARVLPERWLRARGVTKV